MPTVKFECWQQYCFSEALVDGCLLFVRLWVISRDSLQYKICVYNCIVHIIIVFIQIYNIRRIKLMFLV